MKKLLLILLSITFMSCEKESLDPIEELYTQIPEGLYKYKLSNGNWCTGWRERDAENGSSGTWYSSELSWLEIDNDINYNHITEYHVFRDSRFGTILNPRALGMRYSYKLEYPYITLNGANLQPGDDRQRDIYKNEEFGIEILSNGRIIQILRGSNIIMELHKIDSKPYL